jgi:hypothetical protein
LQDVDGYFTYQPKESKPIQTFNAKSRVDITLSKDDCSANNEQALESTKTDQFEVLIKSSEKGKEPLLQNVKDMTSVAENLSSLNLHEE